MSATVDFGNPSYGYKKEKINGVTKFVEDINEQLIIEFPERPWDWAKISRNPNISMYIIDKYIDK